MADNTKLKWSQMSKRELRAPKKKKFQLEYATVQNALEELTETELGEYFRAVAEYELYGEEPETFSDRTVRAIFHTTARELDHQMEKHFARIEQGGINQQGGKAKGKDGSKGTQLQEVLTADDMKILENKYQCCDMLLKEIQTQLDANSTVINYPRRYVEKYAKDSNWNKRIEDDIKNAAMGLA